jgi:hypothetical protein
MPQFNEILFYFAQQLLGYAPMLLVVAAGVGIVSWSPLGRGLLQFLRDRRRDGAVNEQLLDELVHLRATLGEVTERLDGTERLLALRGEAQPFRRLPPEDPRDRISTPH